MNKEQQIVARFESEMEPKTLEQKVDGMLSEVQELLDVVSGDNEEFDGGLENLGDETYDKRLATESTDIIIRCLGIVNTLGYEASALFLEKVQSGIDTYNEEPWDAEEYLNGNLEDNLYGYFDTNGDYIRP